MRYVTPAGIQLIQHYEALRLTRYICPAGLATIGWGHVIRPGEDLQEITREEAEILLAHDIEAAQKGVLRLIRVPLEPGQYDALVSFVFNLGAGALQRSTLRQLINREEHDDVPAEFMRWVRAGTRILKGLILRRADEARLYAGGTTPENALP